MSDLNALFHPSSVAVVGASAQANSGTNAILLNPLLHFNFKGPIYPVNPGVAEIQGLRAYHSLREIPGPVDYVICALGAGQVRPLLEDCADKGVKGLHLFAAGFSESPDEGRKRLEREIVAYARQRGFRIVGPNCFGLSCPASGLSCLPDMPTESGQMAFASQSSAIAVDFTDAAGRRGVRFSKVACYGNGADLNETDFLEFFAADPETRIIAMYLEGIKSPRFLSALRAAAARKPVLILKGGLSGAGGRAVASHTGALVGQGEVWWGACRQAGAIAVETLDEMVDLAVTCYHFPAPPGRRAAILVFGGGFGVKAADDCERGGLAVPPLDADTRRVLASLMPPVGVSTVNPVDVSPGVIWLAEPMLRGLSAIAASPQIDLILAHLWVPPDTYRTDPRLIEHQIEAMLRAHRELPKPVIGINRFAGSPEAGQMTALALAQCGQSGVPVYFSFYSAARAISRFIAYYERGKGFSQ